MYTLFAFLLLGNSKVSLISVNHKTSQACLSLTHADEPGSGVDSSQANFQRQKARGNHSRRLFHATKDSTKIDPIIETFKPRHQSTTRLQDSGGDGDDDSSAAGGGCGYRPHASCSSMGQNNSQVESSLEASVSTQEEKRLHGYTIPKLIKPAASSPREIGSGRKPASSTASTHFKRSCSAFSTGLRFSPPRKRKKTLSSSAMGTRKSITNRPQLPINSVPNHKPRVAFAQDTQRSEPAVRTATVNTRNQCQGGNPPSNSRSRFPSASFRARRVFSSSDSDNSGSVSTDNSHLVEQKGLEQETKAPRLVEPLQNTTSPRPRAVCAQNGNNFKVVIRKALDSYFDEGKITNRQYKRILERASRKVQDGLALGSLDERRVVKLVADYVTAYRSHVY